MNLTRLLLSPIIVTLVVSSLNAQMEKREDELYRLKRFENSFPKVGQVAPELAVRSLSGERVRLSEYQGKTVVLIKAGYT